MSPSIQFLSAEDAWFWYCRMQRERHLGYRPNGSGGFRPCDIDDIALVFSRLCSAGKITDRHVNAMLRYGCQQVRPDRRVDPRGLQAWDEGMDLLYTPLAHKHIVELRKNKSID